MTYFRRFRMELDQRRTLPELPPTPFGYQVIPFSASVLREHATAKFHSFRQELDADVFPCLGRQDGCLKLMREISRREEFVPESTWLIRHRDSASGRTIPVGTIQGLGIDGWGAIQNLGISNEHRGKHLGSLLLLKAAEGFRIAGLNRVHLEVTTENRSAIRLYERLGFKKTKVVYKGVEIAGA